MKKTILAVLAIVLGGTPPCFGQLEAPADLPQHRVWVRTDYLLWWVKDAPVPVPLVTTGDPANPLAGILGQPDTAVLFGDSDLDYGALSGVRCTLGGWLDSSASLGLEVGAFLLERGSLDFSAASDGAGGPPLTLPFTDAETGSEGGIAIAASSGQRFAGAVAIPSSLSFWGGEANVLFNCARGKGYHVDIIAGFRHLNLEEELDIFDVSRDLQQDILNRMHDSFDTRNRFYGGQVGARLGREGKWLAVYLQGQVALGATHQVVDVSGSITQTGVDAFAPGVAAGGVFAQRTNIGRRSHARFAVVPAVQALVALQITPRLRAVTGYDFLYWSDVVRPGNQIDPVLNLSQSRVFGTGTRTGPERPGRRFETSDFFAHGVIFRLEFRY